MQNLLGQFFTLADHQYQIIDIRNVSGDFMVYAKPQMVEGDAKSRKMPARAAFHYQDISHLIDSNLT